MKFCSDCGAPVRLRIPPGDSLPRHCCDACDTVHYQNPKVVAGCIVEADDGLLLLCRRAIEPRNGFWTMPAGFMENGETLVAAARRETREEACAEVAVDAISSVVSVPGANQVHVMFRAHLVGGFAAGAETAEARLFAEADIPWDEIAFRSGSAALRVFLADRRAGHWQVHEIDLDGRIESGPAGSQP